jgi:hypothetical protein
MNRRKAITVAAGTVAAGGAGLVTLTTAFKPDIDSNPDPERLPFGTSGTGYNYVPLIPQLAAELAYDSYPDGGCMYGICNSVIAQLADKIGEPYISFPLRMMKYGHGGMGGYGSTCGTLNGAGALIGMLVGEKKHQDQLIADLFHWYERTSFPIFVPPKPAFEHEPARSVSGSVLCHVSNTNWSATTGHRVNSKERKERCRRMTADVAARTVEILNSYFSNAYLAHMEDNATVSNCMTCHGNDGKLGNTSGRMTCTSCHEESIGHKIFSDAHYQLMSKE